MAPSTSSSLSSMMKPATTKNHTSPESKIIFTVSRKSSGTSTRTTKNSGTNDDGTHNASDTVNHRHGGDNGHKRFPVLGPTRQDTELFFQKDDEKRRSSAHDRDVRPGSSVRPRPQQVSADHYPSHASRAQTHVRTRTAFGSDHSPSYKERVSREYLTAKPPIARSSDIRNAYSEDGIPRKGSAPVRRSTVDVDKGLAHDDDDDRTSFYCVIRSAPPKHSSSELSNGVASVKHSRQLINNRSNQTYVITADTASLLLQSGPPLVIRSATELYSRQNTRLAIQQVTDANRSAKSKSAHVRGTAPGFYGARKSLSEQIQNSLARSNSLNSGSTSDFRARYRSHAQQHRESSGSLRKSQRFSSDETLNHSDASQAYLSNIQRESELSYLDWQYPGLANKSSSANAAFARTQFINDYESQDLAMSSRISSRKPANSPTKPPKGKNTTKTLSPSKYGFHPRSQSPTFKRLVAASEKLNEIFLTNESVAPASESVHVGGTDYHYGSSSSDSIQGLRLYSHNILNGVEDSDYTTTDSSRTQEKFEVNRQVVKENDRAKRNGDIRGKKTQRQEKEEAGRSPVCNARRQNHIPTHRRNVSRDRQQTYRTNASTDEQGILSDNQYGLSDAYAHKMPAGDPNSPAEVVPDAPPTQLHFFLPQLADGMSEVSGPTLTSRSHYQERLDLMNRWEHNDVHEEGVVLKDGNNNTSNKNNNYNGNRKNPPSSQNAENGTKSVNMKQNNRFSSVDRGGRNASKERMPPKDESSKVKRYTSPVRNNQKQERQSRKKGTTYQVRTPPYYLECQLPGEMLKKEVDNFPTLVSMSYSEPESPVQVR